MNTFSYTGSRFTIEELEPSDARSLCELMLANQDRFKPFLPMTLAQNLTVLDAQNYIEKKRKEMINRTNFTFCIKELSSEKKVAGLIILKNIDWEQKQGEFAYGLGGDYSGSGWVSEAILEFKDYAIRVLGLIDFVIIVHAQNLGSVKVAKNCGFTWTKTLKDGFKSIDGRPIDMETYEYNISS